MKIFINGEEYKLYEYDDIKSIIDRYAIGKKSLPRYFNIKNNVALKDGAKIQMEDVRNLISQLKLKRLEDPETQKILNLIKKDFPDIKNKDIGILWINDVNRIKTLS